MEFIPHNYQKHCIDETINKKEIGLFLDMGLGKTVITLSAIVELKYNRFEINKVLVIAPKKVAESTWLRERDKWDHLNLLRIVPILGNKEKRIRGIHTPGDIYVTNRENVQWIVEYLKNDWGYDMVVIDELSSFKNPQSKRFKALKNIRNKINRIVGLTGTPAPNGLIDLWSQVYLLDQGERLGQRVGQYREQYFLPNQRNATTIFNYKLRNKAEESIKDKISDICISMKAEDYLELPDVTYNQVEVVLDNTAQKKYDKLEKEMILEVLDAEIDAASAAALNNKLLQLSNGAVYDAIGKIHEIHNNKLDRFMELVEELNGKNALVFYSFWHDKIRLKRELEKTNLVVRELKTPVDEKDWNDGKIDILLTHPASSAYGLNLQDGGNHVIWYGLNYSLELYQQANKRLHRQGQKEKVIIHQMITVGTRDEDVLKALNGKEDVQEALLQSLKAKIKKYKEEIK